MPQKRRDLAVADRFGRNLRRVRRREDLSQEELGERAGLHRTEVGKLEKGKRVPRIDTLIRLAGAMAVPPGELLDGIDWVPVPKAVGSFPFGSMPSRRARFKGKGRHAAAEPKPIRRISVHAGGPISSLGPLLRNGRNPALVRHIGRCPCRTVISGRLICPRPDLADRPDPDRQGRGVWILHGHTVCGVVGAPDSLTIRLHPHSP
jgi:transcriptional regulator with XRE-family HTH domain